MCFFFLNKKKRRDHRNFNFHITYAIFNADLIHCHTWLPLPAENLWLYGNTNQQYKMRNKKCSKPLKYCYTRFNFYGDFYNAQLKKNTELPLISIKRRVVGNTVRICLEAPTPPHLPPPALGIGPSTGRQKNTSGYKPPGYKPFSCLYWNEIFFYDVLKLTKASKFK